MQSTDERQPSSSGSYDDVYGRWLQACMGKGPSTISTTTVPTTVPTAVPTSVPITTTPAISSYVSSIPVAAPISTPTRTVGAVNDKVWALLKSPEENFARKEETARLESAATATENNLNTTLEAAKIARQEAEALLSRVSTSRQRDPTAPVTMSLMERMKLVQNVNPINITGTQIGSNSTPDLSNSISATYEAALARLRKDQQSTYPTSYSAALENMTSPQQQSVGLVQESESNSLTADECNLPNPSSLPSPVQSLFTTNIPTARPASVLHHEELPSHVVGEYKSIHQSIQQVAADVSNGSHEIQPGQGSYNYVQSPPPTTMNEIISPVLKTSHQDVRGIEVPSAAYVDSMMQLRGASPPLPKVPSFSQPGAGSLYGKVLSEARSPGSSNFQLSPEDIAGEGNSYEHQQQSVVGGVANTTTTPIKITHSAAALISPDPVAMKQAAELLEGKKPQIIESCEAGLSRIPQTQSTISKALWTVGSDDSCEQSDTAIRSPAFESTQSILSQPYDKTIGRMRATGQLAGIPPPQPVPQSTVAYLNLGNDSELVSPPHPSRQLAKESERISPKKVPSPVKVSIAPLPRDLPVPVKAVSEDTRPLGTKSGESDVQFVSEYEVRLRNQTAPATLPNTLNSTTVQDISETIARELQTRLPTTTTTVEAARLPIPEYHNLTDSTVRVPSDGSPAPLSTPSQVSPLSEFKSPTRVSMSPIMNPVKVGSTIEVSRDDSLMTNTELLPLNMSLVGPVADRMNAVEERSPSPLPTPRSVDSSPSPVPNPRLCVPQPTATSPVSGRGRVAVGRGRSSTGVIKKPVNLQATSPRSLNFDPARMRKPHVPRLSKKALQSEGGDNRRTRSAMKPQPWAPPITTKTRSFRVEDEAKPLRTTTPVARKTRSTIQPIETVYSTNNIRSSFARQ